MGTKKFTAQVCIALCLAASAACAQQKVMLDNYYNHETNQKTGKSYHYLWDDTADSGFSQFGELFKEQGAEILTLDAEPEDRLLKEASVYIIVDPDTPAETKEPNYMTDKAATVIARWVKKGGVLLMMGNDKNNAEFDHFNLLAAKFGMQFNKELLHPVEGKKFDMGAFVDLPAHPLFRDLKKIYMKEVAAITCLGKAKPVLTENDKTIIAECRHGKGYVLAVPCIFSMVCRLVKIEKMNHLCFKWHDLKDEANCAETSTEFKGV